MYCRKSTVLQDRDGRPAVRDPTFLAETQLIPKANCDRIMKPQATLAGAWHVGTSKGKGKGKGALPDKQIVLKVNCDRIMKPQATLAGAWRVGGKQGKGGCDLIGSSETASHFNQALKTMLKTLCPPPVTTPTTGATETVLLPNPDIPITVYSEAVAKGTYGGNLTGTRTMSKVSPFNKYTNFSKPMSEYNKVVVDE